MVLLSLSLFGGVMGIVDLRLFGRWSHDSDEESGENVIDSVSVSVPYLEVLFAGGECLRFSMLQSGC